MSVTVLQQPPIAVFRGEEDVSSAGPRREALRRCLRTESPLISVDLGDITFLDSSAVGDLIHMADALAKKGRALEIRRCSRDTLRLLQLAGVIPVHRLPARELVEHPDPRLARAVA